MNETTAQKDATPRRRGFARRLAMQAIYQWQISRDRWQDIRQQFHEKEDFHKADADYFDELLGAGAESHDELLRSLAPYVDRPLDQLDPVERAILVIGSHELQNRPELPYRVILNEAVELAKRFGASEGHKYVNAILDKAAAHFRYHETEAARRR